MHIIYNDGTWLNISGFFFLQEPSFSVRGHAMVWPMESKMQPPTWAPEAISRWLGELWIGFALLCFATSLSAVRLRISTCCCGCASDSHDADERTHAPLIQHCFNMLHTKRWVSCNLVCALLDVFLALSSKVACELVEQIPQWHVRRPAHTDMCALVIGHRSQIGLGYRAMLSPCSD